MNGLDINSKKVKGVDVPSRAAIEPPPECPSILILTDTSIDVKGRFGRGNLGYLGERSRLQDKKEKVRKEKVEKGKLVVNGESEIDEGRVIMSIPISSDVALSQLRSQNTPPITSLEEIRSIASEYSDRYGISVAVSSDMGSNRYRDVWAVKEAGRVKINLHPILQYQDREYIESKIMEAVQDCRDVMRQSAFGWQRGH